MGNRRTGTNLHRKATTTGLSDTSYPKPSLGYESDPTKCPHLRGNYRRKPYITTTENK